MKLQHTIRSRRSVAAAAGDTVRGSAAGRAPGIAVIALLAGLLGGCDYMFGPPPDPGPRVDVYANRFVYLGNTYDSVTGLAIGLKAAARPPQAVEVHECAAMDRLQPVLEMIRAQGPFRAEIVLPENC